MRERGEAVRAGQPGRTASVAGARAGLAAEAAPITWITFAASSSIAPAISRSRGARSTVHELGVGLSGFAGFLARQRGPGSAK